MREPARVATPFLLFISILNSEENGVCVCVCVCVRERESLRVRESVYVCEKETVCACEFV